MVLRYRKLIGASGGGLSVGAVLVIGGNVSLWGMVTILLTMSLRILYRDNGDIDATGSLSVEVRVSRFFKLSFRSSITYQLRDGRETTTQSSNTSTEIDPKLREKARRLAAMRNGL